MIDLFAGTGIKECETRFTLAEGKERHDEANVVNSKDFIEISKCDCFDFSEVALGGNFDNMFEGAFATDVTRKNGEVPIMTGKILEVKDANFLDVSNLSDESKLLATLNDESKCLEGIDQLDKDVISTATVTANALNNPSKCVQTPTKVHTDLQHLEPPNTISSEYKASEDKSRGSDLQRRPPGSEVTIRVDNHRESSFFKLVKELSCNKKLMKVDVYRLSDLTNRRRRTDEEMALFFAALRSMPNLNQLILNDFTVRDADLIFCLVQGHKSLERFHLHFTRGTINTTLLETLAKIPNLKEVSLDVQASFPVDVLLSSSSIQRILVPAETFCFEERHFEALIRALERNRTIRILDLKPKLKPSDVILLGLGLSENTHLRTLRFSFVCEKRDAGTSLIQFCQSLVKNSTIKTVENYYAKDLKISQADCYHMLKLLDSNDSVINFAVFDDDHVEEKNDKDVPSSWENSFFARLMCDSDNLISRTAFCCFQVWDDDTFCASCPTLESSNASKSTTSISKTPPDPVKKPCNYAPPDQVQGMSSCAPTDSVKKASSFLFGGNSLRRVFAGRFGTGKKL